MSKIIKGGNTRFFNFLLKEQEEEEFNPLKDLLPEEALAEIERLRAQEREVAADGPASQKPESENPKPSPNILKEEPEDLTPQEANEEKAQEENEEEASSEQPFDIAQLSLEELLAHPEVSEKLAHLEQEAYEKGFAQGQKDGETLGRKKYETLANRLEELIRGLEKSLAEHVLSLEPQVYALVKLMVEKLILKEVSTSPEVIKAVLREALTHVVEQARVKIHLHPDDTEFLEEVLAALKEELTRIKDFEIVPNPNLHRGGCLLETDFGLIDATLERRWREILKRFEDESP